MFSEIQPGFSNWCKISVHKFPSGNELSRVAQTHIFGQYQMHVRAVLTFAALSPGQISVRNQLKDSQINIYRFFKY